MYGADGRTGANDAVGRTKWTSGRGGKAADDRADGGGKGADSGVDGRTGPTRHGHANGQKRRGRGPRGANGRTGGLGGRGRRGVDGGSGGMGRLGGRGGLARTGGRGVRWSGRRADERVSLGLKGHIPRGPLHSWAPSPLASSERERAGCLGVQWGPARLHIKHSYLAPGLTCLV